MSRKPTGITTRHSRRCRSRSGGGCNCEPSYEAWIWSPRDGRKIRKTFTGKGALSVAKGWRHDAGSAVRKGTMQVVMPVRVLCRHAIERDEILVNPTTNLRLPVANGRRERVASPPEAAELIEALPKEQRCLWWTAALAGLRRGELRALRWRDVDLGENVIAVSRSWDEKEGPVAPKSRKGTRRVPIPASLRKHLLEHKIRTGRDSEDLVFGAQADRPFTPTHIRKLALAAWERTNEKRREEQAELKPIGLHELRHSYVSLMHDGGFSLERIGDYVGHSSAYMTDAYRHLLDGHETEAAKRFEDYLTSAVSSTRPCPSITTASGWSAGRPGQSRSGKGRDSCGVGF